ncbi:MAG: tetratricopeptide repeat protein [Gemmatimonadetes bacterium]|uniref:Tetratricopeptide repeat protein n=1 Tax=Candidatus Kutchimonas denitrificans TaxID=3056748 RepID=A0AAE5CB00_9BACT|nr:tetratricopeptide repeat protein [Gemmatimonadota bacterium]NIR73890.1 tetratricopeptide repeat protein [Candidatus Kutchimonas denitrificans]NIR99696.1 tetratricopeptide repeat protein [Gemmatimonadota bacterium]NIT65281.1 tetratricopeptide repeat protein [Gemmatimonadota bacterium]NIW73730.1 tetratricopeptide repeat protein [Gemmatimonadota bacterium]
MAACRGDVRDHLLAGDRLLGADRPQEAIAEYQVALRQRGEQADVLLRLAHGYAHLDRLDEASDYYSRLLAIDSAYADQAVADFLGLAERALQQRDRARMSRALQQVEAIQPGNVPEDLALPFARYHYELREHAEALPFYLSVLAATPDSVEPAVLYELAGVYYELGECEQALVHYRAFIRTRPGREQRNDARWHAGQCAYELAQADRLAGRPSEALEKLDLVIALGSPQALLDDAWFDRGEILFALGEFDEAVNSFQNVLDLNPTRTGRLVRAAEDRIRSIRYRPEEEEEGEAGEVGG